MSNTIRNKQSNSTDIKLWQNSVDKKCFENDDVLRTEILKLKKRVEELERNSNANIISYNKE